MVTEFDGFTEFSLRVILSVLLPKAKLLLVSLCLVSAIASADTISISPSSFNVGDVEVFITITGSGLVGSSSTTVVFSGPAGTFSVEPSISSSTSLVVWIPFPVLAVVGRYDVTVRATDTGQITRSIGPASLNIVGLPIQGPPLLSLPDVVLAEADGPTGAIVMYTASATSLVDPSATLNCDHASGARYPLGTTIVRCTATDSFGSTSGEFAIVVGDTVPPVLTLPADITSHSAVVSWTATAVDNINGTVPVSCTPASGSTFHSGSTTVICSATDSSLNLVLGTFKVTVEGGPILTLPADITAEATEPGGAHVSYTATADQGATVTCDPPSGALFPLGMTTVQCSATSASGTSTDSFNITVVDTTPPDVTMIKATPSVLWPPNHKMVEVKVGLIGLDLVDPNPTSQIVSVTSNQPVNGTGDGNTSPDWEIIGPLLLNLRAEREGSTDRVYTITVQTFDFNGNSAITQVMVMVSQMRARVAH